MTEYKSGKANVKQENRGPVKQPAQRFGCCGSGSHSNNVEDRCVNCRAFNEACTSCSKIGDFARVWTSKQGQAAKLEAPQYDNASTSATSAITSG